MYLQQKAVDMFLLAADRTGENLFWIGLTDLFHEGKFVWSSTIQEATYTNWWGVPDNMNKNEHFVHLLDVSKGRKWNDGSEDLEDVYALCQFYL